ncbi:MAG: hypothetical protein ABI434_23475 [Burkholderiaceae bacterium]
MDIFAHALWAGAGVMLAQRRWPISTRTAAAIVGLAVLPDIPHLLPIAGWSAFGSGTAAAIKGYAIAVPGQEPILPAAVEWLSHNLHCIPHSAIVAGVVTLLVWWWRRSFWIPLLGWWSHVVIDVFTHSADYYPSPVLWPITREGFNGVAWNTPLFMTVNYIALTVAYFWLLPRWWRTRRRRVD